MNVEWIAGCPPSNYTTGREGNPVSLIVDHWMGSKGLAPGQLFASAVSRFQNPTARVSAQFLIGADGRIGQMVASDDTAYHAGDWSVNVRSIGIEHECSPTLPPSDALYEASAWLHKQIAGTYGFHLVVGDTVRPHNSVVPTACPGTLDLERIVAKAASNGGKMATPERIGQSADLDLRTGEVGMLQAIYAYPTHPAGRAIVRKVLAGKPGRTVYPVYPPVDPDADETMDLGAEPTLFVINVLPPS